MKLSINWAQYYSSTDLKKFSKDELLTKIGEQLGAVDEVVEWGPRFDGVVVAKVVSCEKHENADKLSVCLIDDAGVVKGVKRDKNGLVQVVCGAPNVASGQLVAWIPPSVTVPSTYDKDPFILEAREIRGVVSNGMLASASELGLSSDHNGILVIEPDEVGPSNAKRGTPFKNLYGLDDLVIDIENKMFTHRPDCFGILGIARELAGINHQAFKSPDWYDEFVTINQEEKPLSLLVKNWSEKQVPRFCLSVVAGVEVGPSPVFMQAALTRVGIKPINNIVDVTNFVMHLTGQPIHAYDYDKVKGTKESAEIAVRMSKKGEELTLLGGKKIKLSEGAIVITDGVKPIGLAGVMGGAETEVDSSTKNIIVECANFDMNLIRKTAMTYGIFTDASTRFSKGQSVNQNMAVLAYAVDEIKKYADGKVAGKVIDLKSEKPKLKVVKIPDASRIGALLGLPGLTKPAIKHLLNNVEFSVTDSNSGLLVEVPFWRTDIEIFEDVVEEVGRLYGYDKLPLELPTKSIKPPVSNSKFELKNKIREVLASAGATEILTYSFVHGDLVETSGQNIARAYHIRNALSPDLQYYRMSLSPSLLEKVHPNIKLGYKEIALFEIGYSHSKDFIDAEKLPKEINSLGFVYAKSKGGSAAYYQAKHYLEHLLNQLNISNVRYQSFGDDYKQTALNAPFEPSRSAIVMVGKTNVGVIGEPNGRVLTKLKLPETTAMFELDLDAILALAGKPDYELINRFPSIEQDLCLRTDASMSYQDLTDFVMDQVTRLSKIPGYETSVAPVDVYKKDLSDKTKQTTWRISLSHPERTLTTNEVNGLFNKLAESAKTKLNAERI